MKIRQLGGELFHADGRTSMTEENAAFRDFKNVPKNECYRHSTQL